MNVIYALLIEHANQEQIEQIDKSLDEGVGGNPDEFAAILQRAVAGDEDE